MFDELDAKTSPEAKPLTNPGLSQPAPRPALRTEDIFAEVDRGEKPAAFKPKGPGEPIATVIPEEYTWKKNRLMLAALAGGGLIVIVGGFFILKMFMNEPAAPASQEAALESTAAETNLPEVTPPVLENETAPAQTEIQPAPAEPVDADLDGLTDEDESRLGTNPASSDSDADGLTDREEAKVYLTDPLKPDTDGDGFADGEEIRNGFNPKGAGKLLDINQQP